jgi:hypothetical protein
MLLTRNWKKRKKASVVKATNTSQHQHHTIDDDHCKAFHVSFLSCDSLYIVYVHDSSDRHIVALSHLPNRFHLEVPVLFSHLFSVSKRCKVSGRGAPLAQGLFITFSHQELIVRRQVPPQIADLLHLFCESTWYRERRFSVYDYSHCDVRSYDKKQDRGHYRINLFISPTKCQKILIRWNLYSGQS